MNEKAQAASGFVRNTLYPAVKGQYDRVGNMSKPIQLFVGAGAVAGVIYGGSILAHAADMGLRVAAFGAVMYGIGWGFNQMANSGSSN